MTCASTGKSAFPRCFASGGVQRSDPSSSKEKEQKATRFQSIPGVEDTVVGEYVQSSDFLKCSVYLREALGISSSLAERITIKLAFWGFTSDGQAYVRQFPSPLLLEGSIKLMVESLSNIPGIDLRRVAQNSPFVFIQSPVARYRMQDNLEWLKSSFSLQQDEVGKVLNGNAYILTQPRERNSEPAVSFLKSLNLDEDQLRTVVLRYPRLLSLRVQKLKRTLEKLNELGFDKALAEGIISRFPAVCEWDFFKLVSDLVKIPTPDVLAILYKEVSLTCTVFVFSISLMQFLCLRRKLTECSLGCRPL